PSGDPADSCPHLMSARPLQFSGHDTVFQNPSVKLSRDSTDGIICPDRNIFHRDLPHFASRYDSREASRLICIIFTHHIFYSDLLLPCVPGLNRQLTFLCMSSLIRTCVCQISD